jgi:sugar lactone lactonase YvrE
VTAPGLDWEVVVTARAELGERPVWDADSECLIWVDINAGRLHRFRDDAGDAVIADLGVALGAAAPRLGGGYVLAAADGFRTIRADGRPDGAPVRPAGMGDDVRFNDGSCDPAGRFWAGTVAAGRPPGGGALYRLDADGSVSRVLDGITESNGLGWSPDGRTFYYIDSGEPQPRVRAFAYDAGTGGISRERDLVRFASGDGTPDGLAVDAGGGLWIAMWGGGSIRRYSAAGELLAIFGVPVSLPTCPGFGGRELDELYLTTAWEGLDSQRLAAEPLAGHVLRATPGVRGQPVARYAG